MSKALSDYVQEQLIAMTVGAQKQAIISNVDRAVTLIATLHAHINGTCLITEEAYTLAFNRIVYEQLTDFEQIILTACALPIPTAHTFNNTDGKFKEIRTKEVRLVAAQLLEGYQALVRATPANLVPEPVVAD